MSNQDWRHLIEEWKKEGIIKHVPEEVKKSMRERTSIKMKATSVNDKEADVYAKLNQAEAVKDLANNPNNAGATIMGMNMGQSFAANMQGSLNKPNKEEPKN